MADPFVAFRAKVTSGKASALVKKAAVILSAFDEVVAATGQPSPTAYFAVCLNTLNSPAQATNAESVLILLCRLISSVPSAVVRLKFGEIGAGVLPILEQSTEKLFVVKNIVRILAHIAQQVDSTAVCWSSDAAHRRVLQTLLVFSVDPRPKIRKDAQKAVFSVLDQMAKQHPETLLVPKTAGDVVRDFCARELQDCTPKDCQVALHMTNMLKPVLPLLPPSASGRILEQLFRLCGGVGGNSIATLSTMNCLRVLFHADQYQSMRHTPQSCHLVDRLVAALLDMRFHPNDVQSNTSHLSATAAALSRLMRESPPQCFARVPTFLQRCADSLLAEKPEIAAQAHKALLETVAGCLTAPMVAHARQHHKSKPSPLHRALVVVESCLGLPYRQDTIIKRVFPIFAAVFQALGTAEAPEFALPLVGRLGQLHDDDEDVHHKSKLRDAIGVAIRVLGPSQVLRVLPLRLPTDDNEMMMGDADVPLADVVLKSRTWLLPLLRDHTQRASLVYFGQNLLAQADQLSARAKLAAEANRGIEQTTLETMSQQIWELFPSFCLLARDADTAFQWMAKPLGEYLRTQLAPRDQICKGLTTLITRFKQIAECSDRSKLPKLAQTVPHTEAQRVIAHVAQFSKNFLPILFNILTEADDNKRALAVAAVAAYASVSDAKLVNSLFKKVLKKLLQITTDNGKQDNTQSHALSDIALALCEFLSEDNLTWLYKTVVPQLSDADAALQKKSYNILAAICKNRAFFASHTEVIWQQLKDALPSCGASGKKTRLRCLGVFVRALPELSDPAVRNIFSNVLGEIILSFKETSQKTREESYDVLGSMSEKFTRSTPGAPTLVNFLTMILGGVAGSGPHMKSCSILALSRVLYQYKNAVGSSAIPAEIVSKLLDTVLLKLKEKNKEITKAVIGFVKVALSSLSNEILEPHLPTLIDGLLMWHRTDDAKDRFVEKIKNIVERLVRRFSHEKIASMVPPQHEKLMRGIRKRANQRKRKFEARKGNSITKKVSSFEAELYGSDDEDEIEKIANKPATNNRQQSDSDGLGVRLFAGDSMDMLGDELNAQSITSSSAKRKKGPTAAEMLENKFTESELNGKIIIEDDDASNADSDSDDGDDDNGSSQPPPAKRSRHSNAPSSSAAGGDAKKRGQKLEPYAYHSLNPAHMNRRNKHQSAKQFSQLIGSTRKVSKRTRRENAKDRQQRQVTKAQKRRR